MSRPERVLLIRSGRHLDGALDALRARWPACEVAVVGTGGSESAIAAAGIAPPDTFIYTMRRRFTPVAFACSSTARAARRWRFDHVAVLWNDPQGTGQGNVDRTALTLSPTGFIAVTPDGQVMARDVCPQLRLELRRAVMSLAAAAILGALYLPAWLLAPFEKRT